MTTFNSRELRKDIRALENFHNYEEGSKNKHGDERPRMAPEEFCEKYKDALPEGTSPDFLPKDSDGISAYLLSSRMGESSAFKQQQLVSKFVTDKFNDPEFETVYGIHRYSTTKEDEEGEEFTTFLSNKEQFKSFQRDVVKMAGEMAEEIIKNNFESMQDSIKLNMNAIVDEKIISSVRDIKESISQTTQQDIQSSNDMKIAEAWFKKYGSQVLAENGYQNPLFKTITHSDKATVDGFYEEWQRTTLDSFKQWRETSSDVRMDPQMIKSFADVSLGTTAPKYSMDARTNLPNIDINAVVPSWQPPQAESLQNQQTQPSPQPQQVQAGQQVQQQAPQTEIHSGVQPAQLPQQPAVAPQQAAPAMQPMMVEQPQGQVQANPPSQVPQEQIQAPASVNAAAPVTTPQAEGQTDPDLKARIHQALNG